MINYLSSLAQIEDNYSNFIFDIWGVIHDGDVLYPNVLKVINRLKEKNKKITFLSNAPRRSKKARLVLNKFGIDDESIDYIVTSGELVYNYLKNNQDNNFNEFKKNFYYIGPKRDQDLLNGLKYNQVSSPQDADFAIVTGFDDHQKDISEKISEIKEVKKYNLKLICANPDIIVVKKDGRNLPCAGQIAKYYEDIGGKVIYFGKPYQKTYIETLDLIDITDKNEVLVIGDGLETDILGAYNNNIDSIFITSGIISAKLGNRYGELPDRNLLENEMKHYNAFPKYVLTNL